MRDRTNDDHDGERDFASVDQWRERDKGEKERGVKKVTRLLNRLGEMVRPILRDREGGKREREKNNNTFTWRGRSVELAHLPSGPKFLMICYKQTLKCESGQI